MPPNILPEAFNPNEITPILKNRDFPGTSIRRQNVIGKLNKLRQQKTVIKKPKKKQRISRKHSKTKVNKLRIQRIRQPVLRKDDSLQRQRALPLNFRTLGILPTDVSVENPLPGSRIRQDRTLSKNIQPKPMRNREVPLPLNSLPNTIPPPTDQDILSVQGPARFLDTQPPQQNIALSSRRQGEINRSSNRAPEGVQPQWPLPVNRRPNDNFVDTFPQEQVPFPEFTNFQQPTTSIIPRRTLSGFSIPFQTPGIAYPILAYPSLSAYPNTPWSPSLYPYMYADYYDIDMENLLTSRLFHPRPRLTHMSQFMRTRFGQIPMFPFSRFPRLQVTRRTRIPVQQRLSTFTPRTITRRINQIIPTTSFDRGLPTTTAVGGIDRVLPATTPPSVQASTLVPPPSSFLFREEDFYPFYQQPFYNPYFFDSFDGTFLSDFQESQGNRAWRTGMSNENKAERIKISRNVKIQKIEDSKEIKSNSLRQNIPKNKKPRRKPWYYRNIIRKFID